MNESEEHSCSTLQATIGPDSLAPRSWSVVRPLSSFFRRTFRSGESSLKSCSLALRRRSARQSALARRRVTAIGDGCVSPPRSRQLLAVRRSGSRLQRKKLYFTTRGPWEEARILAASRRRAAVHVAKSLTLERAASSLGAKHQRFCSTPREDTFRAGEKGWAAAVIYFFGKQATTRTDARM